MSGHVHAILNHLLTCPKMTGNFLFDPIKLSGVIQTHCRNLQASSQIFSFLFLAHSIATAPLCQNG
jgi:hypothetical protein